MTVEIKPGPELDWAVAEAVDPGCTVGMLASSGCVRNRDRTWRTLPKFSTDLNAAFVAAERIVAQTWEEHERDWALAKCSGRNEGWTCSLGCDDERVFAATPALTICAAILKLREIRELL